MTNHSTNFSTVCTTSLSPPLCPSAWLQLWPPPHETCQPPCLTQEIGKSLHDNSLTLRVEFQLVKWKLARPLSTGKYCTLLDQTCHTGDTLKSHLNTLVVSSRCGPDSPRRR